MRATPTQFLPASPGPLPDLRIVLLPAPTAPKRAPATAGAAAQSAASTSHSTWREYHRDSLAASLRLRFARDIPVHEVRCFVRPLAAGVTLLASPRPFTSAQRARCAIRPDGSCSMIRKSTPSSDPMS
jgi:hypothetical protein